MFSTFSVDKQHEDIISDSVGACGAMHALS